MFDQRTRQLCKKLRDTAELVYVDAPHLLGPDELPPPLPPGSLTAREEAAAKAAAASTAALEQVVNLEEGGAPGRRKVSCPASPTPSEKKGRKEMRDREGARTWWRCDPEERKRAKAVKGTSGRCEWKVICFFFLFFFLVF